MMSCYQEIHCPACGSHRIIKMGKNIKGVQRYRCQNDACSKKSFMLDYTYNDFHSGIKEKIVDRVINGSGIRDTARVLKINKGTVIG
jgi:transposase-like protein